jgi:hypothetical protein
VECDHTESKRIILTLGEGAARGEPSERGQFRPSTSCCFPGCSVFGPYRADEFVSAETDLVVKRKRAQGLERIRSRHLTESRRWETPPACGNASGVAGFRFMLVKMAKELRPGKRDLRAEGVNDDEPVLVGFGIEAAKYLAPGELLLAEQVRTDDALVKSVALRIVRGIGLIEGMRVRHQNRLNPALLIWSQPSTLSGLDRRGVNPASLRAAPQPADVRTHSTLPNARGDTGRTHRRLAARSATHQQDPQKILIGRKKAPCFGAGFAVYRSHLRLLSQALSVRWAPRFSSISAL